MPDFGPHPKNKELLLSGRFKLWYNKAILLPNGERITKEEMTVACMRIDPVYVKEAGKYLIEKLRLMIQQIFTLDQALDYALGKQKKRHIPNYSEAFGWLPFKNICVKELLLCPVS